MKPKTLKYCTYHSCFISDQMVAKHDCFHKSNKGKVEKCKYLVYVFEPKNQSKKGRAAVRNE